MDFTSMDNEFNQFNELQQELNNYTLINSNNYTENELEEYFIKTNKQNLETFNKSVVEKELDEGGIYWDLNIFNYSLAKIVNNEGLIVVGKDIYKFSEKDVQIASNVFDENKNQLNKEGLNYDKSVLPEDFLKADSRKSAMPDEDPYDPDNSNNSYSSTKMSDSWNHSYTHDYYKYRTIIYHKFEKLCITSSTNGVYRQYYKIDFDYKVRTLIKRFNLYYVDSPSRIHVVSTYVGSGGFPSGHVALMSNSRSVSTFERDIYRSNSFGRYANVIDSRLSVYFSPEGSTAYDYSFFIESVNGGDFHTY